VLAILFAILLHPEAKIFSGHLSFKKTRFLAWFFALILILWPLGYLSSQYFLYAGVSAYNAKNYERSGKLFFVARVLNPTSRLVWDYVAASSIGQKKDPAQVEREIEKMVSLHPTTVASYYNSSRTYAYLFTNTQDRRYIDKYFSVAERGLQMSPYARERYYPVAYWYYVTGDLENARRMINRTITLHDRDLPGWLLLASIYQKEGKKEQTVRALTLLYEQYPADQLLRKLVAEAKAISDIKDLVIPAQFGYGGSYIE
jgi:tetratricopeptide (TPR) repeat protein